MILFKKYRLFSLRNFLFLFSFLFFNVASQNLPAGVTQQQLNEIANQLCTLGFPMMNWQQGASLNGYTLKLNIKNAYVTLTSSAGVFRHALNRENFDLDNASSWVLVQ